MPSVYMVQFRMRGCEHLPPAVVQIKARAGMTAEQLAAKAAALGRAELRYLYPLAPRAGKLPPLHVCGISDGRRVVGEWVTVGS